METILHEKRCTDFLISTHCLAAPHAGLSKMETHYSLSYLVLSLLMQELPEVRLGYAVKHKPHTGEMANGLSSTSA